MGCLFLEAKKKGQRLKAPRKGVTKRKKRQTRFNSKKSAPFGQQLVAKIKEEGGPDRRRRAGAGGGEREGKGPAEGAPAC